jgi:putative sugar O-methyltransferase
MVAQELTTNIPELQLMLDDMQRADPMFQPTQFWEICIKEIITELDAFGLDSFKSHKSALQYYVQRYALDPYLYQRNIFDKIVETVKPLNLQIEVAMKQYMDGIARADADFRVFIAADNEEKFPKLSDIGEDLYGNPIESYVVNNKLFSVSLLSYLRKLAFLKKKVDTENIFNVMEIGGGYGTLGEILLKSDPDRYFFLDIDIPPLAYVSASYLKKVFGEKAIAGYSETRDMDVIDVKELRKKYRAAVICPWQLPKVKGQFELFVNASSFQEMEPEVLENYSHYIDKLVNGYLLLKNSLIGKKPVDSKDELGVKKSIQRDDYFRHFSKFDLVASDAKAFGLMHNNFVSDVMILKRK